ncbi:hypothetical protein J6590_104601 [Homalodisca vitripennis]|nr:hypothetical protein J6590_104601 [Homalodisca vitripennis]
MESGNSPVSENTIVNFAREAGLNINFDESGDENISGVSSDESSDEPNDSIVDDTDEEPSYNPDDPQPSTSSGLHTGNRPLFPTRFAPYDTDTSDSEVDEPSQPTRPRTMARGTGSNRGPRGNRPRGTRLGRGDNVPSNTPTQQEPADDCSSWDEVDEGNDEPYNHPFQFYEICGPKHCPPQNSRPISYFSLFFTATLLETFVRATNQ